MDFCRKTMCILAGVLCLTAVVAAGPATRVSETVVQNKPAFILENSRVKAVLSSTGGRLVSLTDVASGQEIAGVTFQEERLFPARERFASSKLVFAGETLPATAEGAGVRFSHRITQDENRFTRDVVLVKEYRLPDDGAGLKIETRLRNEGTVSRRPGLICTFRFGPAKTAVFPSSDGPKILARGAGAKECTPLTAGWFGFGREDGVGFAVAGDFGSITRPVANVDTGVLEWQCDRTDIPPGQDWGAVTWVTLTRNLPSPTWVSPYVVAELLPRREQVSFRLVGAVLPLAPDTKITLELRDPATGKNLFAGPVAWNGTLPVEQVIPLREPAKTPYLARARLTGRSGTVEFEKTSSKIPGYEVIAPLRNKRLLKPAGLHLTTEPKLLVLNGLHFQHFRIEEAAKRAGCTQVRNSYFKDIFYARPPTSLSWFPETFDDLYQFRAVVMISIDAACLGDDGRAMLKQFVADGGGLWVLGGQYAFGAGRYAGTCFDDLLPVHCKSAFDLVRQPGKVTRGGDCPRWLTWKEAKAQSLWVHDLNVQPAAKVWLKAGKTPLLLGAGYGQGRVAVCAGTVLGEAEPGWTEYWETPAWPAAAAEVLKWLMQSSANQ
jgi:uncharacterized membrane protein